YLLALPAQLPRFPYTTLFRSGRTVTAVLSLSAEPPMVLVSVKSDSALATAIISDGGFSLAMLAEGQEMIGDGFAGKIPHGHRFRSEEHTSELQSRENLVCRLL